MLSKTSKKLVLLTLIALGAGLLFIAKPLFAQTLSLGNQQQLGQVGELGTANDFHNDVQLGLQNLATNPSAHSLEQEIKNQDYKSTWDEFGTNALIDGATPFAEIGRSINQDIIQSVQTEQTYDQQEAKYLSNSNVTPEEVQVMEESGGSDVHPSEPIDPNPSAEANPDASLSSGEDQPQITPEEATSTGNAPAIPGATSVVPETNASPSDENISSSSIPETTSVAPETSAPPSGGNISSSSDETIFDAILQGELTNPSPSEPVPPPAEQTSTE